MATLLHWRGSRPGRDWPRPADIEVMLSATLAIDPGTTGPRGAERLIVTAGTPADVANSLDAGEGPSTGWNGVDLYAVSNAFGQWAPEPARQRELFATLAPEMEPPMSGAPLYAVLCAGGASPEASPELRMGHGRYIARLWPRMMLGVQLDHAGSRGAPTAEPFWRALYIFTAESFAAASRLALDDPFAREAVWSASTFALTAPRGSWIERDAQ